MGTFGDKTMAYIDKLYFEYEQSDYSKEHSFTEWLYEQKKEEERYGK